MPKSTRIANEHLSVEVSSLGAEMQSLTSRHGRSWLWNGDATYWSGRSPVLFPIVGKAPGDRVTVDGKSYEMGQHGFARRREFTLSDSTATSCRYSLTSSSDTRTLYPFDFELSLLHEVEGPVLKVMAEVLNSGEEKMAFGLGFHPAFVWPLPGAEGKQHRIDLDNRGEPALARIEGGLVKPERFASPFRDGSLVLDHQMFVDDAMIFPDGAGSGLTYGADGGPALKFRFENLPNVALWTKPGAPFICIEPWHGTAAELGGTDDLVKRPYVTQLDAGKKARFGFSVEVPT